MSFRPMPFLGSIACICMGRWILEATHIPFWQGVLGSLVMMAAGALLTRMSDDA